MPLIFVYGTLKRGCKNHHHMAGLTFIGVGRTAAGYRMFDLGDYPGLVADAEDQDGVLGEVWEVDPLKLRVLDAFEGTGEGLYKRVPLQMLPPHDTGDVHGYLYLRSVSGSRALGSEWIE